ncbi:MAG: trypsin-like serine protease [Deltaproteobacteria bacterium]|nr:trypsin-like serine protease [Deltaproteobacteria bacterium]
MARLAALGVLSVAVACAACQSSDREVLVGGNAGRSSHPIINGEAPDAPEHGAVVALHDFLGKQWVLLSPFCSGVLVTSTVLLTAGHCVRSERPGSFGVYVGNDPSRDLVEHLYEVSEVRVHPEFDPLRLRNDIALVRLATAVTEPIAPVPPLGAADGLVSSDVGATLDFAGFGQDEDGHSGVKLHLEGPLGGFGCSVAGCTSDGDPSTQFSYTQGWGGPCFGDSGGPAFIKRSGQPRVAGLTSWGDGDCTVFGVSTRVDAYASFIQAFIGTGPSPACGNGTCDEGESCDGRDGTVACLSDCPGKLTGKPSSRYCTVGSSCAGAGCP